MTRNKLILIGLAFMGLLMADETPVFQLIAKYCLSYENFVFGPLGSASFDLPVCDLFIV